MPVALTELAWKQNPRPELGAVTDWWVNPSTGSDSFSGQAQTATGNDGPFQTLDKLCDTLCPNDTELRQLANITVHLAAPGGAPTTYARLALNIDRNGFSFTVVGDKNTGANILLATVANTVPNTTRGRITTLTAGAFTGATQKRLRATTGANAGARACISGAPNSGTDVFVNPWVAASPIGGAGVVNLTAGDNVAIDDNLVTITHVDVTLAGAGDWVLQDLIIGSGSSHGTADPSPPVLISCDVTSGPWFGPVTYGAGTRWRSGSFVFQSAVAFNGVAVQSRLSMTQGSTLIGRAGNANDGVGLAFSGVSHLRPGASWEWENGTGGVVGILLQGWSTLEVPPGGLGIALWGLTGNYATGIQIQEGWASYDDVLPSIPSTANVVINGVTFTYAQLPQAVGASEFDTTIAANALAQLTEGLWTATTENNSFATSATENYVAITGADFVEEIPLSRFAFTASGCKLTYTGPPIRVEFNVDAVLSYGGGATSFTSMACDKKGDLIGTSSNVSTSAKGQMQFPQNVGVLGGVTPVYSSRPVSLVSGDTLQPTAGATTGVAATGQDIGIERLSMTVKRLQGT